MSSSGAPSRDDSAAPALPTASTDDARPARTGVDMPSDRSRSPDARRDDYRPRERDEARRRSRSRSRDGRSRGGRDRDDTGRSYGRDHDDAGRGYGRDRSPDRRSRGRDDDDRYSRRSRPRDDDYGRGSSRRRSPSYERRASRERSRSRSPPRRSSRFDSATGGGAKSGSVVDLLKSVLDKGSSGHAGGGSVGLPMGMMGGMFGGMGMMGGMMTPGMMAAGSVNVGGFMTGFAAPSAAGASNAAAQALMNAKAARELYIGGLPQGTTLTANVLREFFNTIMQKTGLCKMPGQPVLSARINENATFAFVEFRSIEETDAALQLNGVQLLGASLKIGRPKGYVQQQVMASAAAVPSGIGMPNPALAALMNGTATGMLAIPAAAPVAAAPPSEDHTPTDVLFLSNVHSGLSATDLESIVAAFGAVDACVMLGPEHAGMDTTRALVKPASASTIDTALAGLNGLELVGKYLRCARAPAYLVSKYLPAYAPAPVPAPAPPPPPAPVATPAPAPVAVAAPWQEVTTTNVLELQNVLTVGEVIRASHEELSDIREEVSEECAKRGRVLDVTIASVTAEQRAAGREADSVPVYVRLATPADALAVSSMLRGRKFEGRVVGIRFVPDTASRTATSGPPAASMEDLEDKGMEGGRGDHYGGVAQPPPARYDAPGARAGLPEDGLALGAAADID